MAANTELHYQALENAIGAAKHLLARHEYPDDLRTVIVAGMIDQMIEHHEGLLLLLRAAKIGSGYALSRSIFESMYRGMWINFSATEQQIKAFETNDKIPFTLEQLADAIDKAYEADGFFKDLKLRAWPSLCSYAHGGILQLGRRFTGHQLQPAYRETEIFEISTSATTCVLVLVSRFFAVHGHVIETEQTDALIGTYVDRLTAPM